MLKAVLIGCGGIAKGAHIPAYRRLEKKGKVRLCGAFDAEPGAFIGETVTNVSSGRAEKGGDLRVYTDMETMLAAEKPDLADICVPTPFHADYAADMLRRGLHVLCEKPMARTAADCERLVETAARSRGRLMIGQCLRFFPAYDYVKQALEDGRFGAVRTAEFRRLSPPPLWGWKNWFLDEAMSGGALLDLHIHDVDMARYLFGEPRAVSCVTSGFRTGSDSVISRLDYPGLNALAIADWNCDGMPFKADFRIGFEKATVVLDGDLTVYPRTGEAAFRPPLAETDGYTAEIEYFVDGIAGGEPNLKNPPESAAATVRLIETLKRSAERGGETMLFEG
ncbi:MAG: Gfo/Idh/MocA family oxidoreductase [Eubacteriales bacterium]|nr:Gfo/Idh/MocA family oxidoreductase [Eubacteriales bacterium]